MHNRYVDSHVEISEWILNKGNNHMMMSVGSKRAISTLVMVVCVVIGTQSSIEHTTTGGSELLFTYFAHVKDEFYVSTFAYDPMINNPMGMFSTWRGLFIEESEGRMKNFLLGTQPHRTYNFKLHPTKGGEADVRDFASDNPDPNTQSAVHKVPQINMSDICKAYYYRRPKVMLLNTQTALPALKYNDWKAPGCIPQAIYFEKSITSLAEVTSILQSNGYILESSNTTSALYILERSKANWLSPSIIMSNARKWKESPVEYVVDVLKPIYQAAGAAFDSNSHVNMSSSPIFIQLARDSLVDVSELIKYSEFSCAKCSRSTSPSILERQATMLPIVVFYFNVSFHRLRMSTNIFKVTSNKNSVKITANIKNRQVQVTLYGVTELPQFISENPIAIKDKEGNVIPAPAPKFEEVQIPDLPTADKTKKFMVDRSFQQEQRRKQVQEQINKIETLLEQEEIAAPNYFLILVFTLSWSMFVYVCVSTTRRKSHRVETYVN